MAVSSAVPFGLYALDPSRAAKSERRFVLADFTPISRGGAAARPEASAAAQAPSVKPNVKQDLVLAVLFEGFCLPGLLGPLTFAETHTRAAAVFVDEFDTRRL
jgi:hypothetical protein